jgi:hypothetical protein
VDPKTCKMLEICGIVSKAVISISKNFEEYFPARIYKNPARIPARIYKNPTRIYKNPARTVISCRI